MAKREKHVYTDTSEIAHLWASGNKDNARTPKKHFWFEGPFLYSYQTCIGVLLPKSRVLLSSHRYSATTNAQYHDRDRAIHHKNCFYVPEIPDNIRYLTYETEKPKEARTALLKELARAWSKEMAEVSMTCRLKTKKARVIGNRIRDIRQRAMEFGVKASALPKFWTGKGDMDNATEEEVRAAILAFRKKWCKEDDEREARRVMCALKDALNPPNQNYGNPHRRHQENIARALKQLSEAGTAIELQCTARDKKLLKEYRRELDGLYFKLNMRSVAEDFRLAVKSMEEGLKTKESAWSMEKYYDITTNIGSKEGIENVFGSTAMAVVEIGSEWVEKAKAVRPQVKQHLFNYHCHGIHELVDLLVDESHRSGRTNYAESLLKRIEEMTTKGYDEKAVQEFLSNEAIVKAKSRAEAIIAADKAEKLEQARTVIQDWKAHKDNPLLKHWNNPLRNCGPLLRLSEDGKQVQTSWGANVPVEVCPMLWDLVLLARDGQKAITGDFGEAGRVGMYNLNEVCADGGLIVGCHRIAYEEIKYIADLLGYTQQIG